MLNPNCFPYPTPAQAPPSNHHPGGFLFNPNNQTRTFHQQQSFHQRTYGEQELTWSGPMGFPFMQQPATHQPYHDPSHAQPQIFGPSQQTHFFDMIQSSGIQPYPPVMHAVPSPIPITTPNPSACPRPQKKFVSPLAQPTQQPSKLPSGRRLIFDGCNFPYRFLGPSRRESYCSSMPMVAYCEANGAIALPGSAVDLADPKDVRELFDQHANSPQFPSSGCATWIFRGIHVRLCETFADVQLGVAELLSFHPEIIGLDCEWFHKKPDTLSLIQVSSARHCLLIRVCKIDKYPQEFCDLLNSPKIVKVGAGVKDDAKKIEKVLRIPVPSTIDLNWLVACAPMVSNGNFRRGLKKQALSFLHTKMVGDYGPFVEMSMDDGVSRHTNIACTNWDADRLSMLQILYAADDAIFSYMVFMKLYLSFDRKRPCPNFDDSLYSVQPKAADVLAKLHDLVDRPAWMPRHLRDKDAADEMWSYSSVILKKESDPEVRPKTVQNDLTKKFGNILSAITACAPTLDNLAQSALLTLMDIYDNSPKGDHLA